MTARPVAVLRTDRADDVLTLARLANRPGAVRGILDWLAKRTGGTVGLVGADGDVLALARSRARPDRSSLSTAAAAALRLYEQGAPAAVLNGAGSGPIHLVSLGGTGAPPAEQVRSTATSAGDQAPYLVLIGAVDDRHGALLADASRTLGLCWRLEEAERNRQRVASAEAHHREAVLALLMAGSLSLAQQIAAALSPPLPALLRVYLVECAEGVRPEVAEHVERWVRGQAWVVPCPVRPEHLVALVPAEPSEVAVEPAAPGERLERLIAERVPGCRVGVSGTVAVEQSACGYEQAFHALAVARDAPGGYSRFDGHTELLPLLGAGGHRWATELLTPCLCYTPARRADPGAEELLSTLSSWLHFDGAATRHLKIHRNTLAARLRLLNELLGLDLNQISHRSTVWLALRLHRTPRSDTRRAAADDPGGTVTLDRLLVTPAVNAWARSQLQTLEPGHQTATADAVRTWLRENTRLTAAAGALGISVPAVRKRLVKAEQLLGRSLLQAPSAKHELWLAMRALGSLRS